MNARVSSARRRAQGASARNGFGLSEWLDHELYPRVYARLDQSFPAFGFVQRGCAWVATKWPDDLPFPVNDPRPDRLMVYANAPFLVKIHGYAGGVRLLDLVNGGRRPDGPEFIPAVRRLASLAGVTMPQGEMDETQLRALRDEEIRRAVLEATMSVDQEVFWSPFGDEARAYFRSRGFSDDELRTLGLGLHQIAAVRGAMTGKHDAEPVKKSGVLWSELEGYVMLPWRDPFGHLLTLYGRWPATTPPEGRRKTMALPGEGTKRSPLFYDRAREAGHRHLVAVEGLFDAALAQVRGDSRVVAYVAATFSHAQVATLQRHHVESVVLVGDPDGGGDRGTRTNVNLLLRAGIRPYVPPRLPDRTDPDEFIQREGIEAWRAQIERAAAGAVWVAEQILSDVQPESTHTKKDKALTELTTFAKEHLAGDWAEQDLDEITAITVARTGQTKQTLRRRLRPPAAKRARKSHTDRAPRAATVTTTPPIADEIHLSDLGNAKRLARLHGADVRWVKQWNSYYVFDGKLWVEDRTDSILRWAEDVPRELYQEAAQTGHAQNREEVAAWALASEAASRLRAMVDLLKSQPGIAAVPEIFDSDPWALSCPNGVLDLKTFRLHPHRREDLLTKMTAAAYEPDACSAVWEDHLRDNLPDAATVITLQRFAGYTLTGDTRHDRFAFLHGPGGSGKSTTLEALKRTLGSYAMAASFDTFLASQRNPSAPNDDVACLSGARMVIATETVGRKDWAVGVIKHLTGGDTIRARHLYQRSFTFTPRFKLWFGANDRPRVDASDNAFWRRILEMPFSKGRPDESQRDPRIREVLIDPTQSGAAILAWAVKGCRDWQAHGLGVSITVLSATKDYQASMDTVAQFVAQCCILGPTETTTPSALRVAYETWCREAGLRPAVGHEWTNALHQQGIDQAPRKHGDKRQWLRVSLIEQLPDRHGEPPS